MGKDCPFALGVYRHLPCSFQGTESSFISLCCLPSYLPALLMPKVLLLPGPFFMPSQLLSSALPVDDDGI